MGELLKPTGVDAFDSLRGLQLVADRIQDPDARIKRIATGIGVLGCHTLMGHTYLVTARGVYAQLPDEPARTMRYLPGNVSLLGQLDELRYLGAPVDELVLNFIGPDVWDVGSGAAEFLRSCNIRVPVLSLATAMSAEIDNTL